jgi:Uma2 family endonuclease
MSTAARAWVSESEFLTLPESNQRLELVDGEVIEAPSPSYWHQELLTRIVLALRGWADTKSVPVTVVQAPLDVRFAPNRILQPDAMVWLRALAVDAPTPLDVVPDLCIEVLSGNRAYDRVTKRYLYGEAGVREYWIVDPGGVVERRSGEDLADVELHDTRLESPLLPGFLLDLARLFAKS